MIKATELRIGNLIMSSSSKENIYVTTSHLLGMEQGSSGIIFEGIRLTPEWLIKFNITPNSNFKIEALDLVYDEEHNRIRYYTGYADFVHEFQNLYFALTRKELSIVNKSGENGY
jgi:predicted DNA binding protein